jgi:hypothetical protein
MAEISWWKRKWKDEDRSGTAWEDARVKQESSAEVIAGLQSGFKPAAHPRAQLLNQDGQQGRSVELPAPPAGVGVDDIPYESILNVTGDDRRSRVITIHCMLEPSIEGSALNEAEGQLKWGTAGVQAMAFFDFIHGTSFSIAASFVRVSARRSDIGFVAGESARAGVTIGYDSFGVGKGHQPQFTTKVAAVAAAGSSAAIPVPRFATNLMVLRLGAAAAPASPFRIRVRDRTGLPIYQEGYALGNAMLRPMDLSNDARDVIIDNTDPVNAISYRLVWGLAL